MDVKALAKSKRAHTQHHSKKPHHSHKPQPSPSSSSSSTSSGAVGAAKNQQKEKITTVRSSSALPSNWDRYDEEEELDSGISGGIKGTDDVVLPKSKGADFRHLVAEAQSQADASLEGFPSLDDVLPGEFNLGLGSMLVVRGEGMLSWVGDDNFLVDENSGGTPQASFISLNLHALAENLEKVEFSKRLFIEPDLLPADLCGESLLSGSNEEHDQPETTEDSEVASRMSKELKLDNFATDHFKASSVGGSIQAATASSSDFLIPVNYIGVDFHQVGASNKNKEYFQATETELHTTGNAIRKNSAFEAASAEQELDILLDTLSETKIHDSRGFASDTSFPVLLEVSSVDPNQITKKESVPFGIASVNASIDDELDDLLEETSMSAKSNVLLRPQEGKSSSCGGSSKPEVSDDFDSWFDTL